MKRAIFAVILILAIRCGNESFGASPRFEKVSDHCYYLQLKEGDNVAAVVTEEGILLVNPPQEPDLSSAVDALKRITTKAVRWVVFTDYSFSHTAGARFFAERGALLLASTQLRVLSASSKGAEAGDKATPKSENGNPGGIFSFPWLTFDHQMHLFPSNLEIRIIALQHKARTAGDVVVYVPAEKVLFVGDLYEAARYPDIDTASGGSALGWIDGFKQVIDSIPVLKPAIPAVKPAVPAAKPAIPAVKPEVGPEQEKTLEEGIMVVSGLGEVSNLQNMKDLLESCQKLRRDVSRAVKMGRTSDSFLASSSADSYRDFDNLDSYTAQLFEDLAASADQNK